MTKFTCNWIENMMSIETDGFTRPCCLETSERAAIAPIANGIMNAFNDPKLLKLRNDLQQGFSESTRDFCFRCEQLEVRAQPSLRTTTAPVSDRRELKVLQFKMSNKCQLTCAHCGPDRSSGWRKLMNISPHVLNAFEVTDEFLEELGSILPQLTVLKFTGGEPFLDPNHWKILDFLSKHDRSNCSLEYITNGISPFREELWSGWKSINCSVSVDGYEETYEWFRRGSTWTEIVDGVNKLKKYSNVSINYAVTPYTIQDYLTAKEFWNCELGAFPVVYPGHVSLANFPKSIIEKIPHYEKIPYHDFSTGDNLKLYKTWALTWDNKWNTLGWANKLFWWMN